VYTVFQDAPGVQLFVCGTGTSLQWYTPTMVLFCVAAFPKSEMIRSSAAKLAILATYKHKEDVTNATRLVQNLPTTQMPPLPHVRLKPNLQAILLQFCCNRWDPLLLPSSLPAQVSWRLPALPVL